MRRISWIVLLGLLAGCTGKPSRIMPPTIDPVQAGKDAISEYDKNGNGRIDGAELDAVPGVKAALNKIDKNSDKQVSADEITERINAWKESKVGVMSLLCRVNFDGKPLEGATITFIPEKFLGTAVKPAKGTSGPGGAAMCTVDDPEFAAKRISGVQCSFYKVEITGPTNRTLPSKYNTSTTLGEEVALDASWVQSGLVFELRSK